uniref:hypothetical protein n=1 Tax=Castellaniella caeni TaxID=266123 RepID=UPI001CA5777E
GRARKPQPEGERRETKGPGEYPAKHTPCRKEHSDTVGVLGGEIRAMAARAVKMDSGYRPRGERRYWTEDGLTLEHLELSINLGLMAVSVSA